MHFSDRAKQWWKVRTRFIVPLLTCPVWCRSLVSQSRFLTIKREKERDCFINVIWLTLNRPACVQQTLSERYTCLECCSLSLISAAKIISQTKPLITHSIQTPMGTRGHQNANITPLSFTHSLRVEGGDDIDGWQLRTMDAKKPRRKCRGLFTCKTPYVCGQQTKNMVCVFVLNWVYDTMFVVTHWVSRPRAGFICSSLCCFEKLAVDCVLIH